MLFVDRFKKRTISDKVIIFPLHKPTFIYSVESFHSYKVNNLVSRTDVEIISREIKYDIGDIMALKDHRIKRHIRNSIIVATSMLAVGISIQYSGSASEFAKGFGILMLTLSFFITIFCVWYFIVRLNQLRIEFRKGVNLVLQRHESKFHVHGISFRLPENRSLLWLELSYELLKIKNSFVKSHGPSIQYTIMNNNINIMTLPKQEISHLNFYTTPDHKIEMKINRIDLEKFNDEKNNLEIDQNSSARNLKEKYDEEENNELVKSD